MKAPFNSSSDQGKPSDGDIEDRSALNFKNERDEEGRLLLEDTSSKSGEEKKNKSTQTHI